MSSLSLRRALRRLGTALLTLVVLFVMFVEWLSGKAYLFFRWLVKVLHLHALDDALRRVPVWVSLPIFAVLVLTWIPAKMFLLKLLLEKRFLEDFIYGALFKVFWFGSVNYLLRLYAEQYLAIPWIAAMYAKYLSAKAYVQSQSWYVRAAALKRMLVAQIREHYQLIRKRWSGGRMGRLMHHIRLRLCGGGGAPR